MMLSLKPIIARIAEKPSGFDGNWFRKVGGAAEYSQATGEKLPLPMAWVVRSSDPAKPIGFGAADVQIGLDVVIAIANARTRDVGMVDDELLKYRKAVLALLLGFEPPGAVKPMEWLGGTVVDYTDCGLYYRDRYQLSAVVTNYLADPAVPGDFTLDKNTWPNI
jgi:hypothetical protein